MDWLDGVKVSDSAALLEELGVDRLDVARKLLLAILGQIMVDGMFHADPHPGNVLVLRDGTPALIDFGSVGLSMPRSGRRCVASSSRCAPRARLIGLFVCTVLMLRAVVAVAREGTA